MPQMRRPTAGWREALYKVRHSIGLDGLHIMRVNEPHGSNVLQELWQQTRLKPFGLQLFCEGLTGEKLHGQEAEQRCGCEDRFVAKQKLAGWKD